MLQCIGEMGIEPIIGALGIAVDTTRKVSFERFDDANNLINGIAHCDQDRVAKGFCLKYVRVL